MVRAAARLVEVRWHGRGGQGVVTASHLLSDAALEAGKYFQSFPEYGAERSGAPITAYSRISDGPISIRSQITDPDIVVVMDPTLIGAVDFLKGLKEDGALVVNSPMSPQELRRLLEYHQGKVFTVDASRISLDTFKRNIPNTPMLGALIQATGIMTRDGVAEAIRARLKGRLAPDVVDANVVAFRRAYDETREG